MRRVAAPMHHDDAVRPGLAPRFVGTIVIETVLEKFSTAKIIGGEGLTRGHVVRLKGQTPR